MTFSTVLLRNTTDLYMSGRIADGSGTVWSLSLGSGIDDAAAFKASISERMPPSSEPGIAIQMASNAASSKSSCAANE